MESSDKEKLLDNLMYIKRLQRAFFMKINGQYSEWFDLLCKKGYLDFSSGKIDEIACIQYLLSVIDEIVKHEKLELFENVINNIFRSNYVDDLFEELSYIYIKLGDICNTLLDNIFEHSKGNESGQYIVFDKIFCYIVNKSGLNNDFKKTLDYLCDILNETKNRDTMLSYYFFDKDDIISNAIKYYFEDYVDIILEKFEKQFILEEYSTVIDEKNVKINYLNKSKIEVCIEDTKHEINYSDRFDLETQLVSLINSNDKNEVREMIENMFSDYNCSYSLENMASYANGIMGDVIRYILNIIDRAEGESQLESLLNKLFESDCSVYKKIALKLIIDKTNNKINKFLLDKIHSKNANIKYIIRNYIFEGELKQLFKSINRKDLDYLQDDLIEIIEKGPYIKYEWYDENYIIRWKQKRYRELTSFDKIKNIYNKLKKISNIEAELTFPSGVTSGFVKQLSNITEKKVFEMSPQVLVDYMNMFDPANFHSKQDFEEYSYTGEAEVIAEAIAKKPRKLLDSLDLFIKVDNHIYIYMILLKLEEIISSGKGDAEQYYVLIIDYCNKYLDKILSYSHVKEDIVKEISISALIKRIFHIVSSILRKIKPEDNIDIKSIDEFIRYSNESVKDNASSIEQKDSDCITYLINSVQGVFSILILDYMLLLKKYDDRYKDKLDEIKKVFTQRIGNYCEESLILIGWRFYYFCNIDSDWIEDIVEGYTTSGKIKYFIYGFANCRVIEKKYYEKYYEIIVDNISSDLENLDTHKKLLEYLCIGNIMGYNCDKKEDFVDRVIKGRTDADIKYIINLLSNIKRYKFINIDNALDKILFIWERIVNYYKENKEVLRACLSIVKNYKSKNNRVLDIIKCILRCGEWQSSPYSNYISSKALYDYLNLLIKQKINYETIQEILIDCIAGSCDNEYIEIMRTIKENNPDVFNHIKEEWLKKNIKYSVIQKYFMSEV